MNWPNTVHKVEDGVTPLNAAGLNPGLTDLEQRTAYLKQLVDSTPIGSVLSSVEIGLQDCTKGQLVALDPATNRFMPAKPAWSDISTDDGHATPAPSAFVSGVLATDPTYDTLGTVVISGAITDPVLITAMCGTQGPGVYYLSDNGTMTKGVAYGVLPVYCGYLSPRGTFYFNPDLPEYRAHSHNRVALDSAKWFAAGSAPVGFTAPVGAVYGYDCSEDATATRIIGAAGVIALSVTCAGELLAPDKYNVSGGTIWLLADYTATPKVELLTVSPFFGTDPQVKAVAPETGNKIVKVNKTNGVVYIGTAFPVTSSTDYVGQAVTGIKSDGVSKAPVIHAITAGPGTAITQNTSEGVAIPGSYQIGMASITNTLMDMQTINANNVLISGLASDVLVEFPAFTTSSLLGAVRIPYADNLADIKVFVNLVGASATTTALTGVIKIQPVSETGAVITATQEFTFTAKTSTVSNKIYLMYSNETFANVTGNSLVTVTLNADNPTDVIQLAGFGISYV